MTELNANERQIAPRLQWMPNWLEFSIVMMVSLGMFVTGSLNAAFERTPTQPIDNNELTSLLIAEVLIISLLTPFLRARGWTLERLGFPFTRSDIPLAVGLAALAYAGYFALWLAASWIMPDAAKAAADTDLVNSKLNFFTVVAVCVVNSIFEELFVAGYLIRFLKDHRSITLAVNCSVLIRVAYHLYQGPRGIINVVSFALVFGWYFARKGRLWPLIIAHAITDFVGLSFYIAF